MVSDSLDGALDDATYNNNDAAATTGSVSYAAPVLTWTGNLAVGASAVITYTLTVKDPDTGDKVIINTATSANAGSACPPGATAAPCRVTVAVLTPGLTIASSASAGTTTPGSVVTYTVTVTNSGRPPTPPRRSPTRCPGCSMTPPTTTTRPPPAAASASPART